MTREEVYSKIERMFGVDYKQLVGRANISLNNKQDAEDAVQTAMTKALTYWDSFIPDIYSIKNWFSKILTNAIKDVANSKRSHGMVVEDNCDSFIDQYNETAYDIITMNEIKSLIYSKQKERQEVLSLYFILNYRPREIKEVSSLSNAAIRSIIYRFQAELKDKYDEAAY